MSAPRSAPSVQLVFHLRVARSLESLRSAKLPSKSGERAGLWILIMAASVPATALAMFADNGSGPLLRVSLCLLIMAGPHSEIMAAVAGSIERAAYSERTPVQHVRVNQGGCDVAVTEKLLIGWARYRRGIGLGPSQRPARRSVKRGSIRTRQVSPWAQTPTR